MKLIILIVGLVLGFGGGVYWGHHNQEAAGNLAAKEEEWVLKGKMEATAAIKARLDQVLSSSSSSHPTPGTGFVGGSAVGSGNSTDALKQLRDEQDQQLKSMQAQLANTPKK
jgi:hypothetical protein